MGAALPKPANGSQSTTDSPKPGNVKPENVSQSPKINGKEPNKSKNQSPVKQEGVVGTVFSALGLGSSPAPSANTPPAPSANTPPAPSATGGRKYKKMKKVKKVVKKRVVKRASTKGKKRTSTKAKKGKKRATTKGKKGKKRSTRK